MIKGILDVTTDSSSGCLPLWTVSYSILLTNSKQVIDQLEVCFLECRHLLDLARLLAVVRSVVFADPSAGGGLDG